MLEAPLFWMLEQQVVVGEPFAANWTLLLVVVRELHSASMCAGCEGYIVGKQSSTIKTLYTQGCDKVLEP